MGKSKTGGTIMTLEYYPRFDTKDNEAKQVEFKTKLPKKLGKILMISAIDLEKTLKNPMYKFDMGNWHIPKFDYENKFSYCAVCMAGSVMANTFGFSPLNWASKYVLTESDSRAMGAIEAMRNKNFIDSYQILYKKEPIEKDDTFLIELSNKYQLSWNSAAPERNIEKIKECAQELIDRDI